MNLSDPQSLNRYAYAEDQPLEAMDPSGEACAPVNGIQISFCASTWAFEGATGTSLWAPIADALPYIGPAVAAFSFFADIFGLYASSPPANTSIHVPARTMSGLDWTAATTAAATGVTASVTLPQATPDPQAPANACTGTIMSAIRAKFGSSGVYDVVKSAFEKTGGEVNLQVIATGMSPAQFNALQTGRYPLSFWTYITGYGPTVHIAGRSGLDKSAYFSNSNIGGVTTTDFTAHIDSAFAYNPVGWLLHWLIDVLQIFGPRNACP